MVDGIARPILILNRRDGRTNDWLEGAPAVGSEEFFEISALGGGGLKLGGSWSIGFITGPVAEEELGEIIDAVGVGIFIGDECDAGRDVGGFILRGQFFFGGTQTCAEGIVRKFVQVLRVFFIAGEMAGGAGVELFRQEAVEVAVEGGPVGGGGPGG